MHFNFQLQREAKAKGITVEFPGAVLRNNVLKGMENKISEASLLSEACGLAGSCLSVGLTLSGEQKRQKNNHCQYKCERLSHSAHVSLSHTFDCVF